MITARPVIRRLFCFVFTVRDDAERTIGFRRGIQMAHLGECSSLLSNEKCPESCENEQEEPVCASDGNVYRSGDLTFIAFVAFARDP